MQRAQTCGRDGSREQLLGAVERAEVVGGDNDAGDAIHQTPAKMLETQDVCRYQTIVGRSIHTATSVGRSRKIRKPSGRIWCGDVGTAGTCGHSQGLHQEANGRRGRHEYRQNCAR